MRHMTHDDKITFRVGFFWALSLIGMVVSMLLTGCATTVKPCEPEIRWKDKIVVVKEPCPCDTVEIARPDLWLRKLDLDKATDEELAQAIKHDVGELVRYAEALRITCACKETP